MSDISILVLVGSLRAGSTNLQLAEAAAQVTPVGVSLTIYDGLADIPFYNEDIDVDGAVPDVATELRAAIAGSDAILVITPEYNGTIPAVLKNAIDWASRPYGAGAITGKPVAAIGSAFGQFGGTWAHDDARKSFGIAGARVLEDVRLSVPGSLVRFAELHPKDDSEVMQQLTAVVRDIVAGVPVKNAA
ncbi:NAD(P)H-dependent oxidoreductase [Lacisediminihabitans profunda]|uniref:NAD(P)H-dependent oxidoreductase n=1 Tax=Lacisediminihabitans profunda TaxID=2594790 RepID=A0A5C8UQ64_9MICO|nr:NADPH-dependent FMN reductase [Lacisediminihabitans profunda]TXN30597.1 NAD(P)H-dependent oxidoreductase [Lacisediminihabitans profunda]